MKNKAEIAAIKEEVAALNQKLAELTDDELAEVTGGMILANDGTSTVNSQNLTVGWTKRELFDK